MPLIHTIVLSAAGLECCCRRQLPPLSIRSEMNETISMIDHEGFVEVVGFKGDAEPHEHSKLPEEIYLSGRGTPLWLEEVSDTLGRVVEVRTYCWQLGLNQKRRPVRYTSRQDAFKCSLEALPSNRKMAISPRNYL
ncbi:hypothetical protein BDM02DRAFT_1761200 [Thelephora ganbajun]|uniref:Uncharacterized protein n=1 Tax=Thelephora ganbajun TaxID=370292 RepID=A0ACB6Z0G1_THEGA|nr:hypothetical protein BDM02DRAFT_1761200 [Thelephora ganbajun]